MDSNKTSTAEIPENLEAPELAKGEPLNQPENVACDSSNSSTAAPNDTDFLDSVQERQTVIEAELQNSERHSGKEGSVLNETSRARHAAEVDLKAACFLQSDCLQMENLSGGKIELSCDPTNSNENSNSTCNGGLNEVVVKSSKPLCADYESESDGESIYSKSDSTTSTDMLTSASSDSGESESDDSSAVTNKAVKGEREVKGDISLADLPPIESLRITVPEDACVEIGTITSIVDTLVVVESYKGTSALDIDTVLFLDSGKHTLGKVFDILGPVSEPVYAVRFNNQEEIRSLNVKKDTKVYYAPKTEHTTFVFMSEVLKNRGSDASWKDNVEAPPEFQDFSDDEEERRHKNKQSEVDMENPGQKEQNKSRKRPFNKGRQRGGILRAGRFRSPDFSQQRPYFQRPPPGNPFAAPPPFHRPNFPGPAHIPSFPYGLPPCAATTPRPPFPQGFSGPPFPTFGALPFLNRGQNFQQPFYQQRAHSLPQAFGAWGRPGFRPPPPPPPPADQ